MPETEARRRDWFAPLMTLATVVVAVWSLYYSGVQADVARKTFEMTVNEAHAGLQKDLADLQKQLAAGTTDRNLADLLGRLGDLQGKLAEQQRRSETNVALSELQQQLAELQTSLARLKKEQDHKDQEIATLRANLAPSPTRPAVSSSLSSVLTSGSGTVPHSILSRDYPLYTNKLGTPSTWKFTPSSPPPPADDSFVACVKAALRDIGGIFSKYPGTTIYFALAGLVALSKIFGRK